MSCVFDCPRSIDDLMVISTEHVGALDKVKQHRHVQQALSAIRARLIMDNDHIIGTENYRTYELYAWSAPVEEHEDRDGLCYFMPLIVTGEQWLIANEGHKQTVVDKSGDIPRIGYESNEVRIKVEEGVIYRLNDYAPHGVQGVGFTVAMFIGGFRDQGVPTDAQFLYEQYDEIVKPAFKKGFDLLDQGKYLAPRLSTNYGLMPDECWLDLNSPSLEVRPMLKSQAVKMRKEKPYKDTFIVMCAKPDCTNVASVLDTSYPFFQEGCLCTTCNFPNVFIGQINDEYLCTDEPNDDSSAADE